MQSFKDIQGRTYDAVVTMRTAIRLKGMGIDLNHLGQDDFWEKVAEDLEKFGQLLWMLVEKSAVAQGVDSESLIDSLDGDALYAAGQAIREAFLSFCQPSARAALRALLDKTKEAEAIALEMVTAELNKITPEALSASLTTVLNSPASSASTPTTSPSVS
jgi:hypothetical protein